MLVAVWTILVALGIPRLSPAADDERGGIERTLYVAIELARYWNGTEASAIKEISAAHPVVISSMAAAMYSRTGLSPEVVERVQLAVYRELGGEILAIRGVHAIDRGTIISKLTPGAHEEVVAGITCFTSDVSGITLVPIDDRDVAFGKTATVRLLLEHGRAGRELKWLSRASTDDAPLLAAEFSPAWLASLARQPQAAPYRALLESQRLRVTVSVDRGLDVRLAADLSERTAADDAKTAFRKALAGLDGVLATAREQMPKMLESAPEKFPQAERLVEPFQKAIDAARQALEKPTYEQKDGQVAVTLHVEAERPATTAILLLSLLPRAKKAEPPRQP